MSTWKGVSHARMTRSMSGLHGAEYKVLATVRRLIPDGEQRKISQAEIARRARVSEGTVSRTLRKLDGVYVRRHCLGRGRGAGFSIEVLPPPEQQLPSVSTPAKGSTTDPSYDSFTSGVGTPQTPAEKGSVTDPSILMSHDHEQQQQLGHSEQIAAEVGQASPAQLAPATIVALHQAGAHPKLIRRVEQANPGLTPEGVATALAIVRERALHRPVETVEGLAFDILAVGQMPVAPSARRSAPPDGAPRPRGRAVPPATTALPAAGYADPPPAPAVATPVPRPIDPHIRRLMLAWEQILAELEPQISRTDREFVRQARLVELDERAATIAAPAMIRELLASRLAPAIQRAARAALARLVQVRFIAVAPGAGAAD